MSFITVLLQVDGVKSLLAFKECRPAVKAVWAITEGVWSVHHHHHFVIIVIIIIIGISLSQTSSSTFGYLDHPDGKMIVSDGSTNINTNTNTNTTQVG